MRMSHVCDISKISHTANVHLKSITEIVKYTFNLMLDFKVSGLNKSDLNLKKGKNKMNL